MTVCVKNRVNSQMSPNVVLRSPRHATPHMHMNEPDLDLHLIPIHGMKHMAP